MRQALSGCVGRAWPVIGTCCLGAFAGQVDASIVQLALPALELGFDARLHAVSWVAVAYSLAFAAALPIFARLAEIAGRKAMYIGGFALFGLFSALCGLAPSLAWLVALRALQGIAGAMLGANSVVILVAAAGPERRGRAMGIFAAAQAVGICAGPVLGGVLLHALDWRWIFWVTVPVAALGALLAWRLVPAAPPAAAREKLDLPGALLLVPALALLLLSITRLDAWGLGSPRLLGTAAVAALLVVGFLWRERRAAAPLIDIGLFRSPAFAGGIVAVLLSYAMLYGMFFAMSFALVRGYREVPLGAGLHLAVVPVALGLVAPFGGYLADRWSRATRLAGMAITAVAALALSRVMAAGPEGLPSAMLALGLYGAGLGLFIAPSNSATLAAAPDGRAGQAGGLLNLMRAFGTALGVAVSAALLTARLAAAGQVGRTDAVADRVLLGAVSEVMVLLAAMAVLAALASLPRAGVPRRPQQPAGDAEPGSGRPADHGVAGAERGAGRS